MRAYSTVRALVLVAWLAAGARSHAQTNGPLDRVPFLAAALTEMLSDTRAFVARAEVQLPGGNPAELIPLGFACLDGRMRWDLSLGQIPASRMAPEMRDLLRDMKLDRAILLLRPGTNVVVVLPSTRSYVELPRAQGGALQEKAQEKTGFLQKTPVGRETIDGHPCVKYKLTVPQDQGEEAYVWQAEDLKNLPIQWIARVDGQQYALRFRGVRYVSPDARLFDLPENYQKQDGMKLLLGLATPGLGSFSGQ